MGFGTLEQLFVKAGTILENGFYERLLQGTEEQNR